MKITSKEYEILISNPSIPDDLKKELANKSRKESWAFVGT